jgi:N-acetylglutamate synthase-like GNAT family acetyltransferase
MSGADQYASTRGAERWGASAAAEVAALRPARAHDQGAALALLTGAALPLGGVSERFPEGYVVATAGDRLVGVAAVERYERWGLVRSVAVAAEFRSSGLGAKLVADVLARARGDGLDEVFLLTTTAPDFFRKLRFREVERANVPEAIRASAEFASICPASAVCMAFRFGAA